MPHYCYVIVENEPHSTQANIAACGDPEVDQDALNDDPDTLSALLQAGWRPVRETTMGRTKRSTAVLVLLERGGG